MAKKKPPARPLAEEAYYEAEFIAQVLEHPDTPEQFKKVVKLAVWGATQIINEHLGQGTTFATPEQARAIYPHARLVNPEKMREVFNILFEEICCTLPHVVDSIQKDAEAKEKAEANRTKKRKRK